MYEDLKHPNLGLTSAQIQKKIDALNEFQLDPEGNLKDGVFQLPGPGGSELNTVLPGQVTHLLGYLGEKMSELNQIKLSRSRAGRDASILGL